MNFFLGQGKTKEFCGWPGKFGNDSESQGKVKEIENKWLVLSVETILILFNGERMYFLVR